MKGKVRDNSNVEFVPQIGVYEADVVAINPDKDELAELLNTDKIENEPEYVKETKEGDDAISLSFWLKDKEDGGLHQLRFFIVDKDRENKDKTKKQYINNTGFCMWSDSPNNLSEKFAATDYRVAKMGEEELYKFLRNWLNRLDWATNEDLLENKKLFKGNVKELRDLMKSEYVGTVLAMDILKEIEKDGEKKMYRQVYNRDFLPGNTIKFFKTKSKKPPKMVQNFIDNIQGEYGCKDIYSLEPLSDFDGTVPDASSKPKKKVEEDDDSY